jgi:hypothetical protein
MEELAPSISVRNDFKKASPLLSIVIGSPCLAGRVNESESILTNSGLETGGTAAVAVKSEGPLPSGKKSIKSTVNNDIDPIAKIVNFHHV